MVRGRVRWVDGLVGEDFKIHGNASVLIYGEMRKWAAEVLS